MRTLEWLSPLNAFQAFSFDHSDTTPSKKNESFNYHEALSETITFAGKMSAFHGKTEKEFSNIQNAGLPR